MSAVLGQGHSRGQRRHGLFGSGVPQIFIIFLLLAAASCGAAAAGGSAVDTAAAPDEMGTAETVASSDAAAGADANTKADAATTAETVTDAKADAAADTVVVSDDAVAPDAVADAGKPDAAAETNGPAGCDELLAQIDALKPSLSACTVAGGCKIFEYPICDSFGCFQVLVSNGADTEKLNTLTSAAGKLFCKDFHCGCGPPPQPYCLNKQCNQCPPNCEGSCEEKGAALSQAGTAAGAYCGKDDDCTVFPTALCPVGDLPCGGIPVNKNTNLDQLKALATAYSACGNMCKCAIPSAAKCVTGKCKFN